MQKLIIILAIVLCAATVQAQSTFQPFSTHNQQKHLGTPRSFEPPPVRQYQPQYPPDYFTVRPIQPIIPSGPTYGYPGMRGYDERTGLWEASPYTNPW